MDSKVFLKESARTASGDYTAITKRMSPDVKPTGKLVMGFPEIDDTDKQKMIDLLHASIGMQTESAEFSDMLKKHIFYGKPLDKVNLAEEIGDQLWYIAMALRALDTDFETVMERNIAKLKARYPDKFTLELAENRDLDKERAILEGKDNL
jgi:NTP pyrophosphatase (non-canonical NTP hydrolase)